MFRLVPKIRVFNLKSSKIISSQIRQFSDSDKNISIESQTPKDDLNISGLAKALGKFRELEKSDGKVDAAPLPPKDEQSFLTLLRNSEFIRMGDPRGKVVIGKIFQIVNTDLYIDFGGKFYCVCRRPKRNSELYVRNAEVKVRINEMELCARFLGATEDLTLNEASATLLDLVSTPVSTESVNKMENKDQLK